MVSDEERLGSSGVGVGIAGVFAERSQAVGLSAVEEHCLGVLDVLVLAGPLGQAAGLKGATVAECQSPGLLSLDLVHGVEILRGVFFRLSAGEEDDSGNSGGDGSLQGGDRSQADLFVGRPGAGEGLAGGAHVRLEESALEEDVVVI